MKIRKINISNIDILFDYTVSNASLKSEHILDKILIMLDLENVTALEILYLQKISSHLIITKRDISDISYIKDTYDFDENFISSIEDNRNFFKYIQKDENLKFDYVYETLVGYMFNVQVILTPDLLNNLSRTNLSNIFRKDSNHIIDKEEIYENIDTINNNFAQVFSYTLYSSLESDLNRNDEDTDKILNRYYYDKKNIADTFIVEALTPNGGYINFLSDYTDADDVISEFKNYAKNLEKNSLSDEIEARFVCNTSFYTYFILCGIYGLKSDCTITTGLLDNALYIHDDILEKYQIRLDKCFGPLLSERNYVNNRSIVGRLLTSTFNSTVTYVLTVKLKEIDVICEIIDEYSKYDTDLVFQLDNIKDSLISLKSTCEII